MTPTLRTAPLPVPLRAAALAALLAACSAGARTEESAIVTDATRPSDAAPAAAAPPAAPAPALAATTAWARTELDRAAPAEFETATFALG